MIERVCKQLTWKLEGIRTRRHFRRQNVLRFEFSRILRFFCRHGCLYSSEPTVDVFGEYREQQKGGGTRWEIFL